MHYVLEVGRYSIKLGGSGEGVLLELESQAINILLHRSANADYLVALAIISSYVATRYHRHMRTTKP